MRAPSRSVQLGLIALIFLGAGIGHFVRADAYVAIVPPSLPRPRLLVAISGLAELLGGIGILLPGPRRSAGIGLLILLVAVFPANIYMLMQAIAAHKSALWITALWIRLPLQPLLFWWVYRATVAECTHNPGSLASQGGGSDGR
ncbi:MAG TPA: hypothetical protein VGM77_05450 [Gemmatimonadales bacterium]|jgi:uncharacterized membrane protein